MKTINTGVNADDPNDKDESLLGKGKNLKITTTIITNKQHTVRRMSSTTLTGEFGVPQLCTSNHQQNDQNICFMRYIYENEAQVIISTMIIIDIYIMTYDI